MFELGNASAALPMANTTHASSALQPSEDTSLALALTPLACWAVLPLGLLVGLLLLRAQLASSTSTRARSQAVGRDKASCPFAPHALPGQARTEEHAGVQVQVRTCL